MIVDRAGADDRRHVGVAGDARRRRRRDRRTRRSGASGAAGGRRLWAVAAAVAVLRVYAAPIVLSGRRHVRRVHQARRHRHAGWPSPTADGARARPRRARALELRGDPGDQPRRAAIPVGVFVPLGVGDLAARARTSPGWSSPTWRSSTALLALALWELAGGLVTGGVARALVAVDRRAAGAAVRLLPLGRGQGARRGRAARDRRGAGAGRLSTAAAWPHPRAAARRRLRAAHSAYSASAARSGWRRSSWSRRWSPGGRLGAPATLWRAAALAGLTALLSVPLLWAGGLVPADIAAADRLGRRSGTSPDPSIRLQVAGIWPAGDFRFVQRRAGGHLAARRRRAGGGHGRRHDRLAPSSLGDAVSFVLGALVDGDRRSPSSGPRGSRARRSRPPRSVVPFAALAGAGALWGTGLRSLAVAAGGLVAAGVLWSNALAYRDASPGAARAARGAGEVGPPDRRRGADADDRVPPLRRSPLPARRRRPRASRSCADARSRASTATRAQGAVGRHRRALDPTTCSSIGRWCCGARRRRVARPRPTASPGAAITTRSGSVAGPRPTSRRVRPGGSTRSACPECASWRPTGTPYRRRAGGAAGGPRGAAIPRRASRKPGLAGARSPGRTVEADVPRDGLRGLAARLGRPRRGSVDGRGRRGRHRAQPPGQYVRFGSAAGPGTPTVELDFRAPTCTRAAAEPAPSARSPSRPPRPPTPRSSVPRKRAEALRQTWDWIEAGASWPSPARPTRPSEAGTGGGATAPSAGSRFSRGPGSDRG